MSDHCDHYRAGLTAATKMDIARWAKAFDAIPDTREEKMRQELVEITLRCQRLRDLVRVAYDEGQADVLDLTEIDVEEKVLLEMWGRSKSKRDLEGGSK